MNLDSLSEQIKKEYSNQETFDKFDKRYKSAFTDFKNNKYYKSIYKFRKLNVELNNWKIYRMIGYNYLMIFDSNRAIRELKKSLYLKEDCVTLMLLGWAYLYRDYPLRYKYKYILIRGITSLTNFIKRYIGTTTDLYLSINDFYNLIITLIEGDDYLLRNINILKFTNSTFGYGYSVSKNTKSKSAQIYFQRSLQYMEEWKRNQDIGFALLRIKENIKAIDAFITSINMKEDYCTYNGIAMAYLSINHRSIKAMEALNKSIELKSNWWAYASLGSIYLKSKQFNKAIKMLEKSIIMNKSWSSYNDLGWAYKGKSDYINANKAYKKSIAINPFYWMSYRGLGSSLIQTKEYKNAIKNIKKSILLWPKSWRTHRDLGDCYLNERKYRLAIKAFDKSNKIHKTWKNYRDISVSQISLKKYDNAIVSLSKFKTLKNSWEVSYYLGYIFMKQDKICESIKLFKDSISLKSNLYNNFALGWLYIINQNYNKSGSIFMKTKELFSSNQALAFTQMLKGNTKNAMTLFKKGLEIYEDCTSPHALEISLLIDKNKNLIEDLHILKKLYISNGFLFINHYYKKNLNISYSYLRAGRDDLAEKGFLRITNKIDKIFKYN